MKLIDYFISKKNLIISKIDCFSANLKIYLDFQAFSLNLCLSFAVFTTFSLNYYRFSHRIALRTVSLGFVASCGLMVFGINRYTVHGLCSLRLLKGQNLWKVAVLLGLPFGSGVFYYSLNLETH